jgi:hypothetical protein
MMDLMAAVGREVWWWILLPVDSVVSAMLTLVAWGVVWVLMWCTEQMEEFVRRMERPER